MSYTRFNSRYGFAVSGEDDRKLILSPDALDELERQDRAVTLIVVDMQPGFIAALDKATIEAVARQIEHAKSRHWSIVVLEFDPWKYGPTHPELMSLLNGYDRCMMRVKSTDCGASQVLEACDDFHYGTEIFWVVGVMIDACVKATVKVLHKALPCAAFRIIREGCNTDYLHDEAWADFPRDEQIVVSSQKVALYEPSLAA